MANLDNYNNKILFPTNRWRLDVTILVYKILVIKYKNHLSGHFSEKQAWTEVVKIKNSDFSY